MPVVASRSGNLLLRNMWLAAARATALALALLLIAGGIAELWLTLLAGSPLQDDPAGTVAIRYLRPALEAARIETEAAAIVRPGEPAANASRSAEIARQLDEISAALGLHPMQGSLWLTRAKLLRAADETDDKIGEALKMVYFTSPLLGDLTFDRLQFALKLNRFNDPELVEFLRGDISALLLQRSERQSRVVQAYRTASPAGKTFVERAVLDLRPDFLPSLK